MQEDFKYYTKDKKTWVSFQVDGQERIYDFKFEASAPYEELLNALKSKIENEKVSALYSIFQRGSNIEEIKLYLFLHNAIEDYFSVKVTQKIQGKIHCPCQKVTVEEFNSKIKAFAGSMKLVLSHTNCGMICDLCYDDSVGLISDFWDEKIKTTLEDFSLYAPPNVTNSDFELMHFNYPKATWGIKTEDAEVVSTIENYLRSELKLEHEFLQKN